MKVRAQIGMVLNLDKCIGCHTCSVTCKQVWTNRPGTEYVWFNNVESKPGIGYPKEWENQRRWRGGWGLTTSGTLVPNQGGRVKLLASIFANPRMPAMEDYYEPFGFDYSHLQNAKEQKSSPTARPYSLVTKQPMEKISWGPNWEDDLGGAFQSRALDSNLTDVDTAGFADFERTFLMYLPRLCEHCLNPTCIASCPSGSIYKREEDGVVLVDQEKCRGWRMCVTGCPYKKVYFNWKTGKSEKCHFCFPRIESGLPTVCSETCVGRMRYLGVLLYDADRIHEAASIANEKDLYEKQLSLFLDPNCSEVQKQAAEAGIPDSWMEAARRSPVRQLAIEWRLALPLHPEYRTLPMVWYVPPLSPFLSQKAAGRDGDSDVFPQIDEQRIPLRYLANLLTAGDPVPVRRALSRLLALRKAKRAELVNQAPCPAILEEVGLAPADGDAMYNLLALAPYQDRFVIPTSHRENLREAELLDESTGDMESCLGCSGPTRMDQSQSFSFTNYMGGSHGTQR